MAIPISGIDESYGGTDPNSVPNKFGFKKFIPSHKAQFHRQNDNK